MRNLSLLVVGNSVSTLGSSIYLIVVVLLLKDLTDSGLLLGLYQFLALLPAALLLPVSGALVDTLSRRAVVIGSDLFRGVVMLAMAALWLVPDLVSPVPLLLAAFLMGAGNALFVPAVQALIPELVEESRLEQANGLRATTNQLSNLTGNALGGAAYTLLAAPVIFLLNGLSFLLSAVQEIGIRVPPGRRKSPPHRNLLSASREGLRLVASQGDLRRLILSQVGLFVVSPPVVLSLPFLVEDRLREPDWVVGLIFATMLAGAVVAFLLLSRRRGIVNPPNLPTDGAPAREGSPGGAVTPEAKARLNSPRVVVAYGLMGIALLAVPLFPSLFTLFLAAGSAGAAAGVVYIDVAGALQRLFPRDMHGRLFAIVEAGNALLAPPAYLAAGALIDLLSPRVELIYLVAAAPTLLWAAWLYRSGRRPSNGVYNRGDSH
jgi:MFS family permease